MLISYALLAMVTLGVCLAARPIGHMLKVLDVPCRKGRKTHRKVTPLVGGLAIMLPFVILGGVETILFQAPLYFGLLILSVIFLGMGFFDDRGHLPPSLRLAVAAVACSIVVYMAPELQLDRLDFGGRVVGSMSSVMGAAFSVLCLVALQNAVNMADGKNGLVIGLSLIWIAALAVYAPSQLTPILIVLAVGLGITLVFNLRGKLFLGDAGSYALSVVIGALAIYAYNAHITQPDLGALTAGGVALWFLVPVLDCGRLIFSRLLQGSSPFVADRNHLHHLLTQRMSSKRALACYFSLVGVPIAISVVARGLTPFLLLAELVVYSGIIWKLSARREVQAASILPFTPKVLSASVSRAAPASVGAVFMRRRTETDLALHKSSAEALQTQRSSEPQQLPLSNVGY
jgi:UDP-GlcNAc:undecaprenyl-phosphate/decaprenyl-phosphate GlcNAc-1-phosphate transferase